MLALNAEPDFAERWRRMTRAAFDLTPRELATLVAIVAYHRTEGAPMPLPELQRAAQEHDGIYELNDERVPSQLWHAGLIERLGPPHARSYRPTARGLRRAFE
jgi:hypothetical protein